MHWRRPARPAALLRPAYLLCRAQKAPQTASACSACLPAARLCCCRLQALALSLHLQMRRPAQTALRAQRTRGPRPAPPVCRLAWSDPAHGSGDRWLAASLTSCHMPIKAKQPASRERVGAIGPPMRGHHALVLSSDDIGNYKHFKLSMWRGMRSVARGVRSRVLNQPKIWLPCLCAGLTRP